MHAFPEKEIRRIVYLHFEEQTRLALELSSFFCDKFILLQEHLRHFFILFCKLIYSFASFFELILAILFRSQYMLFETVDFLFKLIDSVLIINLLHLFQLHPLSVISINSILGT